MQKGKLILNRFLLVFISLCVFYKQEANAQSYLTKFRKELTPSPMVSALGSFGGIDVKKNTGGIQKSIDLFKMQEGDISYSPTIEYFSTGIRVNDWGSRIGTGWTENITAVISRVVKGVPDERATSRIGDGDFEFGTWPEPVFSEENYQKVKALGASYTSTDGEYDLFQFDIFGNTGQFIIKEGEALLLKNNNEFKIDVLATSPTYQFVITDAKGIKYYFNSEIEWTKYDQNNPCDEESRDLPKDATAWFITKMVSPLSRAIFFTYDDVQYTYLYDITDNYVFSDENNYLYCVDAPTPSTHNFCYRAKRTETKLLSSVYGDSFTAHFNYISRDDIYGDKLLDKITITAISEPLKELKFNYNKVVPVQNSRLPCSYLYPMDQQSLML